MRYVGRLLNGETLDWAQMMRHFIRQQVNSRPSIREAKFWTEEECLLLLPSLSIPCSETTNNVMQSWFQCRQFLRLKDHTIALPGSFTLWQLSELLKRYKQTNPFNERLVFPLLKRLGVHVLANLMDGSGKLLSLATEVRAKGFLLDPLQNDALNTFQSWLSTVHLGPQKLEDSLSWSWKGTESRRSGWILPSKTWHKLFTV
ncbi:hypothetical protein R1flu_008288 [Riccia fluitans]|uniref:Uncharacterized protein n=1 Tax=Riccia fluitans TaxID=41844 RepID=A0ABD1YB92_9MARC